MLRVRFFIFALKLFLTQGHRRRHCSLAVLPTIRGISKKNRLNYQWSASSLLLFPSSFSFRTSFPGFFEVSHTLHALTFFVVANYRFKLLSERFAIVVKQLEEKKASFGPDDDADGKGGSKMVRCSPVFPRLLLLRLIRSFSAPAG
jgi:hypothetical protein